MIVLIVQLLVLMLILVMIVAWAISFPYPSPLLRWLLPPRQRWPERQIRTWLQAADVPSGFLRFFNRSPQRKLPPGRDLLAPADGLVSSTDVRDGTRYLVIALSFWDMHVQFSPCAGRLLLVESAGDTFMDGEGREFAFLREKRCPVQKRIVMSTACGEIAVRLITSLSARRIVTLVLSGDHVERGQRIGRILLGSTVVLELPEHLPVLVRKGERVRAGETIVAAFGAAAHG